MSRKCVLDDGCNPELVKGARFEGFLEIPVIKPIGLISIPSRIIPFSLRRRFTGNDAALGFYEFDQLFSDVLIHPKSYVAEFKKYSAVITPDCSVYRDAPLSVQITNVYRNRAIGTYYQRQGINIITNVRWGSRETFTTSVFPEKIAFLGAPHHNMVAIGTYGCVKSKQDKCVFREGLEAMLVTLEPRVVLVYGSMPSTIFKEYSGFTRFVQYDDWISSQHKSASMVEPYSN